MSVFRGHWYFCLARAGLEPGSPGLNPTLYHCATWPTSFYHLPNLNLDAQSVDWFLVNKTFILDWATSMAAEDWFGRVLQERGYSSDGVLPSHPRDQTRRSTTQRHSWQVRTISMHFFYFFTASITYRLRKGNGGNVFTGVIMSFCPQGVRE